jgi:KipI family sensor histidine kinase inhibitor
MMTGSSPITLKAVGDSALLVEFENHISEIIHEQVLSLTKSAQLTRLEGIREIVTGYRALLIHYDPLIIDFDTLCAAIPTPGGGENGGSMKTRHWQVPVLYGAEAGYDLKQVAKHNDLTEQEVIRIHSASVYRVYMVGFAPGWTFLGGLNSQLFTPRLETPRMEVPTGCVSIGGQQTLIGGPSMPSGWNLIGQTPERTFAPERNNAFLFAAGDRVSFRSIEQEEFDVLSRQAAEGAPVSIEINDANT